MATTVTYHDHLPELIARLPGAVSQIVRSTALSVVAEAQENIKRNHQIRTGHMLGSGHMEPGEDQFSAWAVFSADYSAYQELGTRYLRARPFLLPSVEHHRQPYADAFHELERLVSGV